MFFSRPTIDPRVLARAEAFARLDDTDEPTSVILDRYLTAVTR